MKSGKWQGRQDKNSLVKVWAAEKSFSIAARRYLVNREMTAFMRVFLEVLGIMRRKNSI